MMSRRVFARRVISAVIVLWLILFFAMFLASASGGSSPSPYWFAAFGVLLALLGLVSIVFSEEVADIFIEQRTILGISSTGINRVTLTAWGVVATVIGIVLVLGVFTR